MSGALAFPFAVDSGGRLEASGGDDALRAKVVQVLFTTPGERVEQPDFGCGLFNLVFEPNDELLSAAMSFTIGQALNRWLGELLILDGVDVSREDETILVEVAYTKRADLRREAVRVKFR